MDKPRTHRYSTQKLNNFANNAWAVIEEPKGAIVIAPSGQMLMRLSREQARDIAIKLNAELQIMQARPAAVAFPSVYGFA